MCISHKNMWVNSDQQFSLILNKRQGLKDMYSNGFCHFLKTSRYNIYRGLYAVKMGFYLDIDSSSAYIKSWSEVAQSSKVVKGSFFFFYL